MSDIFIPLILGTTRQGRMSEPVAKFVYKQVEKWNGVETKFIDIRQLKFSMDDAGESIKDAEFSATCQRADGFIIVVPEYNHSFPGLAKMGRDETDTVMEVSTSETGVDIKVINN